MKKIRPQESTPLARLGDAGPGRPRFRVATGSRTGTPPLLAAMVVAGAGPVGEEMRLLRAKVRTLDEQSPFRCFGVVSSAAGEGKSTIALGLAAAMAAERDRRVLVIDADLRKPALSTYLALPAGSGLTEWLQGDGQEPSLHLVEPPGFSVLASGNPGNVQPELLGGERMERLLEAARESFDVVIVDCPPLVPVADAVIVQDLLDGFLFVVRARHSPRETILKAVSHLKAGRIRGVVFNGHRDVIPGYETYAYRQYGYR